MPNPAAELSDVHIVRGSERLAKRRCKRAWDLGWRQGWQPIIGGQALEFGTAYHAGMEAVYQPSTWDSTNPEEKLTMAIEAFTKCCNEQRDAYLKATSQTRLTWSGRDDYEARLELGTHMLEYYVLQVHPKEDQGLRPAKTEIKFQVPLKDASNELIRCWNSPNCGQNHEPGVAVVHEGRIDVIFEDLVHGGYLLGDWKTIGGDKAIDGTEKNSNRFSREDLVWMHDQLSTYCWATRSELKLDVRGFILAEIRKDWPRVPVQLNRRRNGALFSQDKNQATTLEIYEAHVREWDMEAYCKGAYDGFLDFLEGPEAPIFHKRYRVPKSPTELKQVGINLALEVQDMVANDVRIYPESGPITCPRCAFRAPCEMMMRGLNYEFTLRSDYQQESRY